MFKRMLLMMAVLQLVSTSALSETLSFLASRNLSGDVSHFLGVAEVSRKIRESGAKSVLLDLGGALSPSEEAFDHRRKGSLTVDLMNQAGYAAWSLAGRDLAWSNQLTKFLRRTDFPVLAANLHRPETGRHLFQVQPYTIIRASSMRIGLIGIAGSTHGVTSSDPVASARYYARMIADRADLIIVASSAGPEADVMIAESIPEIDLVIGEQTEARASEGENGWRVSVPYAQGLWGVDVTVSDGRVTGAVVSQMSFPEVSRDVVQAAFVGWTAQLEGEPVSLGTVIGQSDGGFQTALTSPLGYFVADIMREATATDGALVLSDHFPSDFVTGEVTVHDLYRAYGLPFTAGVASMKGSDIISLLELSDGQLSYYPSGIHAVYSQGEGGLVESLISGSPIDPRVEYTVAIEVGASSNEAISGSRVRDTGDLIRDMVGKHIRTSGRIKGVVDGRIQKR